MNVERNDNALIIMLNCAGVAIAYGLLGVSLWLSTKVLLSTKGYWSMGIVLLTLSLINVVIYRFDFRGAEDKLRKIEDARNDRMLAEYITDEK